MLHSDYFAIAMVSFYLAIYCVLLQFEATIAYATAMLVLSPLVICWMVYMVIKYGKYSGPALGNNEFGYQDKK